MTQAAGEVQEEWFPIIRDAVRRAAQEELFETLVAVLLAVIIVTIAPVWLVLHYRHLNVKAKQRAAFERVRDQAR